MITAKKLNLISVEDYLKGELISSVKHEYLGGVVYAMAGARNMHNLIALNTTTSLNYRLRGRTCCPFNSDTKVRVQFPTHIRFYYPDASVVCRQDSAAVVVYRRGEAGFVREVYEGVNAIIPLSELGIDLPLEEIYQRVEFIPEQEDDPLNS
jgi:Uma2 family endonuclease